MSLAFENLETDNEFFQKQLNEYQPRMREYFLTQLLFGQSTERKVQKALEDYEIRFFHPNYQIVVFEVKNGHNDNKGYLQMEMVKNYIQDINSDQLHADVLQIRFRCLAVILNYNSHYLTVQNVMHRISNTAEELRKITQCEITVGLGSVVSRQEDLHSEYIRIMEALSYGEIFGKNTMIHADAINHIMLTDAVYPFEEEKRLVTAIQSGNLEAVKSQYGEIRQAVRRLGKDTVMRRQIELRLLGTVQSIYVGISGEEENTSVLLQNPPQLKDLGKTILETALAAAKCYQDRWEMKNILVLREAIGYIHEHYTEELTIDDIASAAHTSVSYLYSVFKEANEVAPMQYLNQCRIRKAAELLAKTDEKIKDIAVQCGFFSIQTFNRQFSKQVGISPKEYRVSKQHPSAQEKE